MRRETTAISLRQYLLGLGEEKDRVAIEDRYLTDTDFSEQVEAAESDLVDDYVRGELPARERASFEARCRTSVRLRERVAFARQLAVTPPAARPDAQSWLRAGLKAIRLRPAWSAAGALAVLLLVAGIGWLARPSRPAGEGAVRDAGHEDAPAPSSRTGVVALTLTPGLTRAAGGGAVAAFGHADASLELRLEHEGRAHASYTATIRTPEGATAWEQAGLAPVARSVAAVSLVVPAERLRDGDYVVLLAATEGPRPETIAEYALRVVRR